MSLMGTMQYWGYSIFNNLTKIYITTQTWHNIFNLPTTNDNNMTTTKWDLHSGVPLVPAWYMRPLTYPSLWGASKSPFLFSCQLSGLGGQWKGESGFFHSNTQPCKFFGTLSIHLAFRSLSHSTQFPCEKGSKKEEPRSSRRLDCGNGQMSNGPTTLWRVALILHGKGRAPPWELP